MNLTASRNLPNGAYTFSHWLKNRLYRRSEQKIEKITIASLLIVGVTVFVFVRLLVHISIFFLRVLKESSVAANLIRAGKMVRRSCANFETQQLYSSYQVSCGPRVLRASNSTMVLCTGLGVCLFVLAQTKPLRR